MPAHAVLVPRLGLGAVKHFPCLAVSLLTGNVNLWYSLTQVLPACQSPSCKPFCGGIAVLPVENTGNRSAAPAVGTWAAFWQGVTSRTRCVVHRAKLAIVAGQLFHLEKFSAVDCPMHGSNPYSHSVRDLLQRHDRRVSPTRTRAG